MVIAEFMIIKIYYDKGYQKQKNLFQEIKALLERARNKVIQTVNTTMVHTYFEIGRIIVENEQKGKEKAEYGAETLIYLSQELSEEFGKGFSVDNLQYMRKLYLSYGKYETVSRKSQKNQTVSNQHIRQRIPLGTSLESEMILN